MSIEKPWLLTGLLPGWPLTLNLSASIDNARLHEIFGEFGTILSCKVAADYGRKSRGYEFVQFDKQESAESAIENLNGATVEGKQIFVGNFVKGNDFVHRGAAVQGTRAGRKSPARGPCTGARHFRPACGPCTGARPMPRFGASLAAPLAVQQDFSFVKKGKRVVLGPEAKYTNLYMKNLDQDTTEELIELKFSRVW